MNIIELIKGQFGHGVAAHLASQLGETESSVSKAIQAFIPAVLAGMIAQSDKTKLLQEVTRLADTSVLAKFFENTPESNQLLANILSLIYGDKVDTLMSGVASFADIKNTSAAALLGFTTLTSLATVGRYAKDQGLDAQGLGYLLDQEKTNVANLLPIGFSLAAVGLGKAEEALKTTKDTVVSGVEGLVETMVDNISNTKEKLEDLAENSKGKFETLKDKASDKLAQVSSEIKEDLAEVKESVSEKATEVVSALNSSEEKQEPPVSLWKWLLPLILLLLTGWFVWKTINKKEVESVPVEQVQDSIVVKDSTYNDR